MTQLYQDLAKTKALLMQGWCQEEVYRPSNPMPQFCLDGAIAMATGCPIPGSTDMEVFKFVRTEPRAKAVVEAIFEQLPVEWHLPLYRERPHTALYSYNDVRGRTQAEVIDLVNRAAIEASHG